MKLAKAKAIADKYVALLAPFCDRIEIAGSIRREKEEVGDIERMSADAIVEHVRAIIDNDYYALDHGLEDVRRSYVEALLEDRLWEELAS